MAAGFVRPFFAAPRGGPSVFWAGPGDSIERGAEAEPPFTGTISYRGGWRIPLFAGLTSVGAQPDFRGLQLNANEVPPVVGAGVGHNGNSGASTAAWLAAFASTYASAFPSTPPHGILMHTGANDADTVGAAQAIGQLVDLAAAAAPRATIFVGNVLKRASASGVTVNTQLAIEIATRKAIGMNVKLVDLWPWVPIGPDGLHPSAAGYAIMGRVWLHAILPYVT